LKILRKIEERMEMKIEIAYTELKKDEKREYMELKSLRKEKRKQN
jgi:hypothetical protein